MQLFYEEQERQDMQRRLSKRNSRAKSWRRSFARTNSGKNVAGKSSKHHRLALTDIASIENHERT